MSTYYINRLIIGLTIKKLELPSRTPNDRDSIVNAIYRRCQIMAIKSTATKTSNITEKSRKAGNAQFANFDLIFKFAIEFGNHCHLFLYGQTQTPYHKILCWGWLGCDKISSWVWLGCDKISSWGWLGCDKILSWGWLGYDKILSWSWLGSHKLLS